MNYRELIKELNTDKVKQLLDSFEIPYRETDNALIMPTVCHNADIETASWKLYYYKESHIFHCYTDCSKSMSIFTFLKQYYEVRNIEYNWYSDIYEVVQSCSNLKVFYNDGFRYNSIRSNYADKKNRKELEVIPEGILDIFTKTYPVEWLRDGISEAAMDKFNILYSIPQNKIIIPHYNVHGELVGIRGRALDPWEVENIGKYMPIQIENKWYSHPLSLNLYGFDKTLKNIKQYGICYVGESEKFVLQSECFSIPNCSVAVCGSTFNKYHLDLLMRYAHPQEIVICFDNEEKKGEQKYFDKLWNMCMKYKNYANISFIYDRKGLTALKDSPTDEGEGIFLKLLVDRIRVK